MDVLLDEDLSDLRISNKSEKENIVDKFYCQLENIHFPSLSTSHTPCLRTTPLVQLFLHIDTSWPLSPVLYW